VFSGNILEKVILPKQTNKQNPTKQKKKFTDHIDQMGNDWLGKRSRTQQRTLTQARKSPGYFLSKAMKPYRSFCLPSLGSIMEGTGLIAIPVVASGEFRLFGQ